MQYASAGNAVPTVHPNAGLGAVQPAQGLAVLIACIDAGTLQHLGPKTETVLTASPLYWAALIQQRHGGGLALQSFAAGLQSAQAAQAHVSGAMRTSAQLAASGADFAQPASSQFTAVVGSTNLKEVQGRIASIAAEVIGQSVEPSQSLMEVSSCGFVCISHFWMAAKRLAYAHG